VESLAPLSSPEFLEKRKFKKRKGNIVTSL
jgi:hypothetical protein